jgi:hypothetical protein
LHPKAITRSTTPLAAMRAQRERQLIATRFGYMIVSEYPTMAETVRTNRHQDTASSLIFHYNSPSEAAANETAHCCD